MKKYIILVLALFCASITNVSAANMATRSCIYKNTVAHSTGADPNDNWVNYLTIDYLGLGTGLPMLGDIDYFSQYEDGNRKVIFSYTDDSLDHYINWNSQIPGMNHPYLYWTEAIIDQKIDEVVTSDDKSLICPSKIYVMEYTIKTGIFNPVVETTYDLYACGNNYGDYNEDTCPETWNLLREKRETANHDGTAGKLSTLEYYTGTLINNAESSGNNPSNVQEQYNETTDNIEMFCSEESIDYDVEECNKAKMEQEQYVGQAEDQGITKEQLAIGYENYRLEQDYTYDESDPCYSLLGNPEDNVNKPPAYYMNFVFNLIKYAAIVLLFVLTIVEFFKAVPSNDQDAIKKATQKTIKRLLIAVIIFFLPDLINFVLQLLGIISDPTCGIGG